ncbi:MAG: AtpZ/AtpI family protein [Acidobacteria bacterium]|nr:AtpZ/AtpI family protein [Acidobacteriota bacterium]
MRLSKYKNLGDLLSVGIMFPACIGIGYGIGYVLDQWSGRKSTFKALFLLLGIAAAFINLFKVISKLEREGDGSQ